MQLFLEEDQTVNAKTMSVVEPTLTENIPNVSPSLNAATLPIPIKESTDLDILTEKKNEDSTEDPEKRNGISEIQSEEDSCVLKENENGHNTVETGSTTDISEKEDVEINYDDNDMTNELSEASVPETVNGKGKTVDRQEQNIKETEKDNVSSSEKEGTVNAETGTCEPVLSKVINEPAAKDMETDLDFSDDNAADESFEIKLDSSFEDLEDATKEREITDNIIKIDIGLKTDMAEKSEDIAKQTEDISGQTEDIAEKTEDIAEITEDIAEITEDIAEKTEVTPVKTDDITDKTDDIAEKTEDIAEITEVTPMKTDDITEKTDDIAEKAEDIKIASANHEMIEKRVITTINKSDGNDEIENANLTENITAGNGDAQKVIPPKSLVPDITELSKLEETDLKSFESETVKELESVDTEKTFDGNDLSLDSSVSGAIQSKGIEPVNTVKEPSNEELVNTSDNETITKLTTEINESDKESLHEVQPMEECQADVENSPVVSVDASEPEPNTAEKISMDIDAAPLSQAAPTIETEEGDEKEKVAVTSPKAPKERSSSSDVEIMDVDNDDSAPKNKEEAKKPTTPVPNKKRDSRINLDIFSDEEDDEPESKKEDSTGTQAKVDPQPNLDTQTKLDPGKECVTLDEDDDDDDIMVIDDEAASKNNKETEEPQEKTVESDKVPEIADKAGSDNEDVAISADSVDKDEPETPVESESETKRNTDRPLAASDFINNFKTKIGEMTRADLEEFCLLKIVEGVVDRSNLSEIKDKLKQLMLSVEEWRKKTLVLNKQNRDLQIVLRTVQEEQKRRSDEMIIPLKITRSVGMQVLIGDGKADPLNRLRPNQKRPASTPLQTPPQKPAPKPEPKTSKPPIPVPRLVPAQSPTKAGPSKPSPLQNATVTSNTKNGMKPKSAEKRPLSDTVDLTDDEPAPPSKRPPPVRLVPSNQLLAPRVPMVGKTSSPRQVYIPIGQQANIRPGQKIAFKSPGAGPSPRARIPEITVMRNVAPRVVAPRGQHKHPAPLPQAYQQPQPPNWKALPPAPDLKISKIENGIVVSWKIDGYHEDSYEEIVSYQLYAYQETSQPASTFLWNKIGDIKALPLPMACTLTQFIAGYKYYFAVRAVDVRSRLGPFSLPGSILLLNK